MIVELRIGHQIILLLVTINFVFGSLLRAELNIDLSADVFICGGIESKDIVLDRVMPLKGSNQPVTAQAHIYEQSRSEVKLTDKEKHSLSSFLKGGKKRSELPEDVILADYNVAYLIFDSSSDKYYLLIKEAKSWSVCKARKVTKNIFQIDGKPEDETVISGKLPTFFSRFQEVTK